MGTKLRMSLLKKMYPNDVDKYTILKTMQDISYKHQEKRFVVNFTNKKHVHKVKPINVQRNDSEILQLSINRDAMLKSVLTQTTYEGPQTDLIRKHIVLDFSSPNIAKPFHFGHLRSTIIGNFIANINSFFNNKVTKINYLGDWGTQFGLLQYGLQAKNIDVNDFKSNPIKYLYDTYVYANKLSATDESVQIQARKYFSDIEQGNTSLESWKKIREITVKELENIYRRLGIQFDDYHWESDYNGRSIKDVISLLEQKKIIALDESGKKVAKVNNRNVAVLKSDNSTLYITRDIAALLDRYQRYKFDKMLYIVDNAQTDHFATLFEIVKQLDEKCTEGCEHIKFGRIKGMSTRSGNVVFLNDILDEAKRKMYEKQQQSKNTRNTAMNEETSDILGTTAVIINDLKQRRQRDYVFDWDKALQSDGDTGIKLQYLHCRLWSLEQNCGVSLPHECDPSYLPEEIIGDVVAELAKFEDILHKALVEYEACIVVNYLFRLARHVNRMFNELKVKGLSPDIASQRLLVYHSARIIVKTGLEILGVKPLKQM